MSSSNHTASNDAEAGSFIPASQRPDGTWRKPRRVRDGYVPQEEVPLYESKGRQFAARQMNSCPVGLTPEIVAEAKARAEAKAKKDAKEKARCPIPGLLIQDESKKKKKSGADKLADSISKVSLTQNSQVTTDPAKRLKNLKKKMREIEVLEAKLNNGEIENPEKDQLDKVKNKDQVLSEISKLELIIGL